MELIAALLQDLHQVSLQERKRIFRVRELLLPLRYDKLVLSNIIPNLKRYHNISAYGKKLKYAPWIYQIGNSNNAPSDPGLVFDDSDTGSGPGQKKNKELCYLFFGHFCEELIKFYVSEWLRLSEPLEDFIAKYLNPTALIPICQFFFQKVRTTCFPPEYHSVLSGPNFTSGEGMSYLISLIVPILRKWNRDLLPACKSDTVLEVPVSDSVFLQGHPDIISGPEGKRIILDVKTTVDFTKMADESYLQILSYYAISKAMGSDVDIIGLVLPVQKDIVLFNISAWTTWPDFLAVLFSGIKAHLEFEGVFSSRLLGSHIRKTGTITRSLLEVYSQRGNLPCQMYLSNPQSGSMSAYEYSDLHEASCLIRNNNIPYFTHSSLIINLSKPSTKKSLGGASASSPCTWALEILKKEMEITRTIGGRGCVIHVGKALKDTEQNALNVMEQSIRYCLPMATKECPLLLETPAGQGTELCVNFQSMVDFYNRFNSEEKEIFKLCLDSCHTNSAGYDPVEYITTFYANFPGCVSLVHFNDSKTPCGSRVDRHKSPGKGYIGPATLKRLHDFCVERNIPMVIE